MFESDNFLLNDVSTVQGVNPLNFPATVGELSLLLVCFDVHLLMGLVLQLFDVIIINNSNFKALFFFLFLFLLVLCHLSPSNGKLNRLFILIGPLNLPLQKVRNIW